MEQTRKYPIGIQTFEEIIKGGYLYIDKTKLIYDLINEGKYYFLSRPRRFGKSLLISTLEAYFSGKKDLFKGLFIEQKSTDWETYPVFHLDFSGNKYITESELYSVVNLFLSQQERIYGKDEEEQTFGSRFQGLLKRSYAQTGKQAVILIDEYDKPLTDSIRFNAIQEKNRDILQSLYGVLKNADRYIKFAFLTGVTRYGKLGIFSASNNPDDISTIPQFATLCGISETELHNNFDSEINRLAQALGSDKDEAYAKLKHKYNGYHFASKSEGVYNPFSLLKALKYSVLQNYWFITGTPTYLTEILKRNSFNPALLEEDIKATEESLCSFGNGENNVIAALYQSGYLTIKDETDGIYTLGIPNEEVADGLTKHLIPEYTGTNIGEYDPDIIELRDRLRAGDANGMMEQLQTIMEEIPFENNEPKMMEAHFRNMVYLMIRATGYPTYVEMAKLGGRIDICFETEKFAYIIECKRDLDAATALEQINEKKYAKRLSNSGKKIYKIGANFSTKKKNLAEWKVQAL